MQMNLGKTLPNPAQHLLMPIDLEVRMQTALHQYASTAEFDRLPDLVVDRFEVEDVALFRLRPFERAVESTEGAVFGAVVGVINIAIDDVSDYALRVQLAAYGVGFHADADQVVGMKHFEGLLFG